MRRAIALILAIHIIKEDFLPPLCPAHDAWPAAASAKADGNYSGGLAG
jgi:hypothetical protein